MKKIVFLLVFFLLLSNMTFAENMGVMVINPTTQDNTASIDDMKLNMLTEIDGFGIVTPVDFSICDTFGWYYQGWNTVGNARDDYDYAGVDAEFVILWFDILNTELKERHYLDNYDYNVSAAVVMDEQYEFSGWVGQLNYDNGTADYGPDAGKQNTRWVINGEDAFAINPMAVGHYMCVCKVPNAVVKNDAPLKMIITIGDIEMTYNIRY